MALPLVGMQPLFGIFPCPTALAILAAKLGMNQAKTIATVPSASDVVPPNVKCFFFVASILLRYLHYTVVS